MTANKIAAVGMTFILIAIAYAGCSGLAAW